ncbi:hypothetical protein D9M69_603920 [compost metagenome]
MKTFQMLYVFLMQQAPAVWGKIQKKVRSPAHRGQVNIKELFRGFYLPVFLRMIKPSRPDRNIYFGGDPVCAVLTA